MNKKLYQKIVAAVTSLALILSPLQIVIFVDPVKAGGGGAATGGATEPTQLWAAAQQTLTSANSFVSTNLQGVTAAYSLWSQNNKMLSNALNYLMGKIGERLMNKITDDMIKYIKGESGGGPKFITDFSSYITDAVDQAAGDFLDKYLGLGFLCEPFRPFLQLAFKTSPFSQKARCSISDIGANLTSFFNDFSKGGWDAWIRMAEQPQNTIHGAYLATYDELNAIKNQTAEAQRLKTQVSGGFKPLECTDDKISSGMCSASDKGNVITPGSILLNMTGKALTADFDRKNMEISLFKSKVDMSPYLTAIGDALIWRLTKETMATLKKTQISEPSVSSLPKTTLSSFYVSSSSLTAGQRNLGLEVTAANKLLASLASFKSAITGIGSQGVATNNNSLESLKNRLEDNKRLAEQIKGKGDGCDSPNPPADTISTKIDEVNHYLELLGTYNYENTDSRLGKIATTETTTYNYSQSVENYLNDLAALDASTDDEINAKLEQLAATKEDIISKVKDFAALNKDYTDDVSEETGEATKSALTKLAEDVDSQTTNLSSNVMSNKKEISNEILASIGISQAMIDAWISEANSDNAKLQDQYNRCFASDYPKEEITNNNYYTTSK